MTPQWEILFTLLLEVLVIGIEPQPWWAGRGFR